ncbi:MAG: 30S ribosomal protein S20 [bacterium]|nr:30S ribosomal protein S20 [bacterium]
MPITKTAKRALRGSKRKENVNSLIVSRLEASLRLAKKTGKKEAILKAISLTDRAAKKKIIHNNKASRIKSALSRLPQKQKS